MESWRLRNKSPLNINTKRIDDKLLRVVRRTLASKSWCCYERCSLVARQTFPIFILSISLSSILPTKYKNIDTCFSPARRPRPWTCADSLASQQRTVQVAFRQNPALNFWPITSEPCSVSVAKFCQNGAEQRAVSLLGDAGEGATCDEAFSLASCSQHATKS